VIHAGCIESAIGVAKMLHTAWLVQKRLQQAARPCNLRLQVLRIASCQINVVAGMRADLLTCVDPGLQLRGIHQRNLSDPFVDIPDIGLPEARCHGIAGGTESELA
jgi:hypothetical protein